MSQFKEFMESKEEKYNDFVRKLSKASSKHKDVVLKTIGTVEDFEIYQLSIHPDLKKRVCIVCGIHGDEPGGPHGIVEWLDKYTPPEGIGLDVFPLANPYGYVHNTRHNKHYDMNRQWDDPAKLKDENAVLYKALKGVKYELLLTLHEDPRQKGGFYLYCSDRSRAKTWTKCVDIARKYFDIYDAEKVYGDPVKGGLSWHDELEQSKENKCFETWMYEKEGVPYLTTEPSDIYSLPKRVRFMCEFVDFVLKNF